MRANENKIKTLGFAEEEKIIYIGIFQTGKPLN